MLPAPQEAAASPDADRVEPRVITSPEHCDQSVICLSSLGQIGNELSTGAMLSVFADYFVLSTNDPLRNHLTHMIRRLADWGPGLD